MITKIEPRLCIVSSQFSGSSNFLSADEVVANAMRICRKSRRYDRGSTIYDEGDRISTLFRVTEGAVRICKFRSDGQRQIEAFYLPGEFFGFDVERSCRFSAEAITNTTLQVADVAEVLAMQTEIEGLTGALWQIAVEDLHRSQEHILLLGCRNAQERVLAFLDEMASRLDVTSIIDLPMSRQDIADYLGMTIETVSRTLTLLVQNAEIAMPRPRSVMMKRRANCHAQGLSRPFHV